MHEDLGIPRSYLTIAHEEIISFFISRILFSLVAIAVLKAVLYPFESCPVPKGLFEQGGAYCGGLLVRNQIVIHHQNLDVAEGDFRKQLLPHPRADDPEEGVSLLKLRN